MQTILYLSILISALFINANTLVAQELKFQVENSTKEKLILINFPETTKIVGYNGTEILIQKQLSPSNSNTSNTNDTQPINSEIGLMVDKKGTQLEVTYNRQNTPPANYYIKVPNNLSLKLVNNGNIMVSNMLNEIEIINSQTVKLMNTSGSIVVSGNSGNVQLSNCTLNKKAIVSIALISGNISADFSTIETKEPIQISTISGNISMSLPPEIAADLNLKSSSGIIKSEFNYSEEHKKTNQLLGNQINFKTNGGGTEITITTVNGNISLRKYKSFN